MLALLKTMIGPIISPLIKLIPDKNERARAQENIEQQMLMAMTGLVEGQLAINVKEAEHGSIFVAGWRPWIGWVCGIALAWNYILQPIITWGVFIAGVDIGEAPHLDVAGLMPLMMGMLGLGGLRTYEKRLGVARKSVD